ncbi:MAG: DUF222 domain-containing protein [Sporichthya sp.]|nr:DUF222 domain-containing protein [Sporichthya sp.]
MTGEEAVSLMRLAQRQKNVAEAVRLATVVEVAVRGLDSDSTVTRMATPDRWSPDEIRAGLAVTVGAANSLLDYAWAVVRRLPALHEAMLRGDLDEPRARAIAAWTEQMSDEHARAVVDDVLDSCSIDAEKPLNTAQLVDRVKKLGIALDPDWAMRAFAEAVARRRVTGWLNDDGTATLSAQNQEPARVAGARGRLRELARRAKKDGDPRPVDHLNSELCLGLLDGTYAGLTDEQILAALASTRPEPTVEPTAASAPTATPAPRPTPEPESAPEPAATTEPTPSHTGVQLTVKLSTLLGLDRHPGDLAGWGPAHAEHARDLAQKLSAGQWRFAVVDAEGQLVRSGLTPARPKGWVPRKASDAGILHLLVSAGPLKALTEGPLKDGNLADTAAVIAWLPVIEDIARRTDGSAAANPDPASGSDPRRRFPTQALRRDLELRIPTCIGTGCRRPATTAEMDHTLDHALGGDTVRENLGPVCGHDHALKSKGGWRLKRLDEFTFRWTTRLGRTYDVGIAPLIDDLPPPMPQLGRQAPRPEPDEPSFDRLPGQ